MSGNPVRYSNVRKTLARRLIAHSTRSIQDYHNEHCNVGYVGGGSDPGLLRAATVCIGEDAEIIADWVRSAVANPLEPDVVRSPGTEAAAKAARAALHIGLLPHV